MHAYRLGTAHHHPLSVPPPSPPPLPLSPSHSSDLCLSGLFFIVNIDNQHDPDQLAYWAAWGSLILMAVVPPAVEFKANRTPSSSIVLAVLGWATLLSGGSECLSVISPHLTSPHLTSPHDCASESWRFMVTWSINYYSLFTIHYSPHQSPGTRHFDRTLMTMRAPPSVCQP